MAATYRGRPTLLRATLDAVRAKREGQTLRQLIATLRETRPDLNPPSLPPTLSYLKTLGLVVHELGLWKPHPASLKGGADDDAAGG